MKKICCVILVPAKRDKEYLDGLVHELMNTYHTPYFFPHITIYGEIDIEPEMGINTVKEIVNNLQPIKVQTDGMGYSEKILQTLFFKMKNNERLIKLYEDLKSHFHEYDTIDWNLNPHVSLIYKSIPEKEKQHFISSVSIPQLFSFNTLVLCSRPREARWEEVEKWEELYRCHF